MLRDKKNESLFVNGDLRILHPLYVEIKKNFIQSRMRTHARTYTRSHRGGPRYRHSLQLRTEMCSCEKHAHQCGQSSLWLIKTEPVCVDGDWESRPRGSRVHFPRPGVLLGKHLLGESWSYISWIQLCFLLLCFVLTLCEQCIAGLWVKRSYLMHTGQWTTANCCEFRGFIPIT